MVSKIINILFILSFSFYSCNNRVEKNEYDSQSNSEQKIYTCPMHPQIIRNEPTLCPICGMKLVEKIHNGESINNENLAILLKPVNQYVVSSIKTTTPKRDKIKVEINASGVINYDTRNINTVSARVSGRIEKLYVKFRYQPILKGQKLMDIYSQELVTEQENYLFLLKNDASNESILQSVETRLLLLGFSQTQVNALKVSRIVSQSVTIFSPYTGHLHDIVKSEINSGMKESNLASGTELSIREGMYLKKGQTIFNIYDISDLWVDLNVYSDDLELIKVGQTVALYTNEGDTLKVAAKIDFIQPILSEQLQTTIARVYLNNMNKELIVGTLLKAKINSGMKEGIFVPNSSVLNLGNNNVVFLKVDGAFKSTLVNIGIKTAEEIEIISGISESDEIALNAQMLIDSESFVKISR